MDAESGTGEATRVRDYRGTSLEDVTFERGRGVVDSRGVGFSFPLGRVMMDEMPPESCRYTERFLALIIDNRIYGARRPDGRVFLDITDDLPIAERVKARNMLYKVSCNLTHIGDEPAF